MRDELNILILSCGTRNKIVQYFKKELLGIGQVIAADCSYLAPALYEADKFYIVPSMDEQGYIDSILSLCRESNVKAVLSLIDPELNLLAKHKQDFLEIGVIPIVSDYDKVQMCFDKYKMYEFLVSNGFNTIRSYLDKEKFYIDEEEGLINFPVFVKPVTGSASMNINKATSKDEIDLLFGRSDNLMIQEFMDGKEIGVDVYVDMISCTTVAIFAKEKIKMRAGETDKSISFKDDKLFNMVESLILKTGLTGVLDIDIFEIDGQYYVSEINPRFGGGYPHAYECNMNVPRMILNNLKGKENDRSIGCYDERIVMMKYNDVMIVKK